MREVPVWYLEFWCGHHCYAKQPEVGRMENCPECEIAQYVKEYLRMLW
jgi:hypothetical protein